MNFNLILTEKNNNIFNIILNDQKNQNTLSENMINELTSALDIADKDNDVKVIILSSKGNIFCAGHNLKDLNSKRLLFTIDGSGDKSINATVSILKNRNIKRIFQTKKQTQPCPF